MENPTEVKPLELQSQPKKKFFNKFKKLDVIIILIICCILAILTFYSAMGDFYHLQRGNEYASVTGMVLYAPALLVGYPLTYLASLSSDSYGAQLGVAIWLELLSPALTFVFWFFVFWFLAKFICKFLSEKRNMLWKHVISIMIAFLISAPYAYFSVGQNQVNACLSGALNSQMMSGSAPGLIEAELFTIGPDSCIDPILDAVTHKVDGSKEKVINYCQTLSSEKIVYDTQLSYRQYCMNIVEGNQRLNESETSKQERQANAYVPSVQVGALSGVDSLPSDMKYSDFPFRDNMILGQSGLVSIGNSKITFTASKSSPNSTNPAWISILIPQYILWESISFDEIFTNEKSSQALLSIFLDAEKIGTIDGRIHITKQVGPLSFNKKIDPQLPHVIGFRLDAFAYGTTTLEISNIRLGSASK